MDVRGHPLRSREPHRPTIDTQRLWAGGVATAVVAALFAIAVLHVLLLTTPRPLQFFSWILGLATTVAVLLPFLGDAPLSHKLATAAIMLVVGLAISSLASGMARGVIRSRRAA